MTLISMAILGVSKATGPSQIDPFLYPHHPPEHTPFLSPHRSSTIPSLESVYFHAYIYLSPALSYVYCVELTHSGM